MEIPIACSTCLKKEDRIVLMLLRHSAKPLTVDELTGLTGFSEAKVRCALRMIGRQAAMAYRRKQLDRYCREG